MLRRATVLKISQLSDSKVLITLGLDDMKNFGLDFQKIGFSDPHSKKILSRLCTLACASNSIKTEKKTIMLEAIESGDGVMILVSVKDCASNRKKYRIKRIREYPCYRFENVEALLCAIEKLCNSDSFFYNNSAFFYKNSYYLVFDYPVVCNKAKNILSEFSHKTKGTKTFVARLHESGKTISQGNAIMHIGSQL